MKKIILSALLLCMAHLSTFAQSGTPFIGNVVLFTQETDLYGFVVYKEGNDHVVIMVREKDRFKEEEYVAFNKKEEVKARLITQPIRFGDYYLGLYRVRANSSATKKYFTVTMAGKEYVTYKNAYAGNLHVNDLYLDRHAYPTRAEDANDPTVERVMFTVRGKQTVSQGMPLIDEHGNVAAIIASRPSSTGSFAALDMYPIYNKLVEAGAVAGDKCMYFNLLQENNNETVCQKEARQRELEAARKEQEQREKIEELAQRKEFVADSLWHLGKQYRTPEVRAIYVPNIDRPFALGLTIVGNANVFGFYFPEGGAAIAGFPNTDTAIRGARILSFGYSAGLNIYLRPDLGKLKLTLKPRYTLNKFSTSIDYRNMTTLQNYEIRFIKSVSYEMPVMLDWVMSRKPKGNEVLALGYSFGLQQYVGFRRISDFGTIYNEEFTEFPKYTHKIILEWARERNRTRISISANYQFAPIVPQDFTIVANRGEIMPFYHVNNGYFTLAAELSFRLWNRWLNNYKTMY